MATVIEAKPEQQTTKHIPGLIKGKVINYNPREVIASDQSLGRTHSFLNGVVERILMFSTREGKQVRVDLTDGTTATYRADKITLATSMY